MRMVTLTITYDMDDPDKRLSAELQDWLEGNVTPRDIYEASKFSSDATIKLVEVETGETSTALQAETAE